MIMHILLKKDLGVKHVRKKNEYGSSKVVIYTFVGSTFII